MPNRIAECFWCGRWADVLPRSQIAKVKPMRRIDCPCGATFTLDPRDLGRLLATDAICDALKEQNRKLSNGEIGDPTEQSAELAELRTA